MITVSTLFAPLLLLQATPVVAAEPEAAPPVPPAETAPAQPAEQPQKEAEEVADADKLICKRQTVAGSRLRSRKICRTEQGWIQYKIDTQNALNHATSRHSDTPI
ncbi:hypothetical protein ACFCW2_12885 [Qipengyuania sp. DSG2-2]|uniref:hypothetical protein n=1 Tax=Qipengyuania sp. DGS2-2 TaxID=3349631 RepID=UPI0036D270E0